jgi:hypothetical protein
MNIQSPLEEKTGILRIVDGIKSDQMGRAIQAGLASLRGVHSVEVLGAVARIRFDPRKVTEQQFYEAVETAGFHASGFQSPR